MTGLSGSAASRQAIEIAQKILDYPIDHILSLEADAEEGDE